MYIAWATIALLVFLQPGFWFLHAAYSKERFSRDAALGSAITQLALLFSVAALIHGGYFVLLDPFLSQWPLVPSIDLDVVLRLFLLSTHDSIGYEPIINNLSRYRTNIALYILGTAAAGWVFGAVLAHYTSFSPHQWLTDIRWTKEKGYVWAHVLTRIAHEDRLLMYRGWVKDIFVSTDGRISYIVLAEAERYFMHLGGESPETSDQGLWRKIGESNNSSNAPEESTPEDDPENATADEHSIDSASEDAAEAFFQSSDLLIEGEDISNVVFEHQAAEYLSQEDLEELIDQLLREESGQMELSLQDT